VGLQWALFTIMYDYFFLSDGLINMERSLVLYMIYYPSRLKYVDIDIPAHDSLPPQHVKTKLRSDEWRLSVIVSWAVAIHLLSDLSCLLVAAS
jgi:hypothetical protein